MTDPTATVRSAGQDRITDSAATVAEIQALVDRDGPHAPSWGFSGCACGWTVTDVREGRRMPQYLAHIVGVVLNG